MLFGVFFFFYLSILYRIINSRELTLITIQRSMPWIKGLMPTDFKTSVESDAPIKNIVIINPLRANPEINLPAIGTLSNR
jgi:hypothetical protein